MNNAAVKLLITSILTLCGLLCTIATQAQEAGFNAAIPTAKPNFGTPEGNTPTAPSIRAEAYVLMDATTGKVIAEKNYDKVMPPASLTKMMSMYVISQALKSEQITLDDKVRISKKAWSTGGSKMFLKEGQQVTVSDLVQGIVVDSGNDATVALAEYIAGSETSFADLMNQEAQQLGMSNSHFVNSTGMPHKDHYSTPLDMAVLSAALIHHFPEYYPWYSQKWFTFNDIKQPNRNRLLWSYKFADGIKTGQTDNAGFCLAASAINDGMRLVTIVMNAPSDTERTEGSQRLLTYGFRFYKTYKLYGAGETIATPKVWKGDSKNLPIGIAENVILTIPQNKYKKLQVTSVVQAPLTAPIHKGDNVGILRIQLDNETLTETPLLALSEISQGGMWSRMKDSVDMTMSNWLGSSDDESTS